MKKSNIWTIASIIGFSFASLLYLQVSYFEDVIRMRKEQFNESVSRSLFFAARQVELDETKLELEEQILETLTPEERAVVKKEMELQSQSRTTPLHTGHANDSLHWHLSDAKQTYSDVVHQRFVYQRDLLYNVIYHIIRDSNEKALAERINFHKLDQDLRTALNSNGVKLSYHIRVTTADGKEVYRCADYDSTATEYAYKQKLFPNAPPSRIGILYVHFPEKA